MLNSSILSKEVQQCSYLEFFAKQVVEGFITGLHKSPYHGFSVEFAEHRQYNKGEPVKHIDWKLFGRTDKLFTKRFEEETNLRCQLVIDCSSSMYYPKTEGVEFPKSNSSKIAFSIYAAAALIELLKRQRDAVGLSAFSEKINIHTAAKSNAAHHKLLYHELTKLIQAKKNEKTESVKALHQIAESIHKRSLVIIFSDMLDFVESKNAFSSLQHLKYTKHEVILFHVVQKQSEVDFNFDNKPHQFIDLETGESIKLKPKEVKEFYVNTMSDRLNALKLKCAQYKIDYVEADISAGINQILLPYLIKRQRLY